MLLNFNFQRLSVVEVNPKDSSLLLYSCSTIVRDLKKLKYIREKGTREEKIKLGVQTVDFYAFLNVHNET